MKYDNLPQQKIIFVHIPKTGGMTITKFLISILSNGDIFIAGPYLKICDRPLISDFLHKASSNQLLYNSFISKKFKTINLKKHSTSLEIRSVTGERIWKDYYKFSFARNPYDRYVSAFFWMKKNQGENLRNASVKELVQKIASFSDFSKFIQSDEFNQIREKNLLKPMVDYIHDSQDKLIIDYIGRFENFPKELEKLSFDFNLNSDYKNTHINKSKRYASYRDYYASDIRRIVQLAYDRDIKYFGYEF